MVRRVLSTVCLMMLAAPLAAQRPSVDVVPQPATWVPFASVVERDGVEHGRFWRDGQGSSRLELNAPDGHGRTIVIHNIPQAKYYVYGLVTGWTVQPMLLPTHGWHPPVVWQLDVGTPLTEPTAGLAVHERVSGGIRERRAAALNFFAVERQLPDGRVERHAGVTVGEPPASRFVPPPGAAVTVLAEPGGIVALPSVPSGGGQ